MADEEGDELSRQLMGTTIDGWTINKKLGNGANGVVFRVKNKKGEEAVLKLALNKAADDGIYFEDIVMSRVVEKANMETRTAHLVRRVGGGKTEVKMKGEKMMASYVCMECLPENPIEVIGRQKGEMTTIKVLDYGLQLLKAIYDMHECGLLHRDIKPENIGLYDSKVLVMYDLGMARSFVDKEGKTRQPRSRPGMRGTEEWSSLAAEMEFEQGRIDDLWGWLYCMVEWMNCRSGKPQAWSAYESHPHIRQWMKSHMFTARSVLNNCPFPLYKANLYLRSLGRTDVPNYFYLATLLQEGRRCVRSRQKSEPVSRANFDSESAFLTNLFY